MPAPNGLLTPKPTPTAMPMTRTPIRIFTISLFRLLRWERHLQERFILAAFAFCCQWFWPGHTWQSVPPFKLVVLDFRPQWSAVVVELVMMASISVSKGLRWLELELGLEMFEDRGISMLPAPCFSAEGVRVSEPNVSWEALSLIWGVLRYSGWGGEG